MRKRINAVLAILIALLSVYHTVGAYQTILNEYAKDTFFIVSGRLLTVLILFHSIISFIFVFTCKDKKKSGTFYDKQNIGVILQRLTGILLTLGVIVHLLINLNVITFSVPLLITIDMLLLFSVAIHMVESFPKALVTLGYIKSKRIFSLFCLAVLAAELLLIAFYFVIALN